MLTTSPTNTKLGRRRTMQRQQNQQEHICEKEGDSTSRTIDEVDPEEFYPALSDIVLDPDVHLDVNTFRHYDQPRIRAFNNDHVLVNTIRVKHKLLPLQRSRELDEMAKLHAQQMASEKRLYHTAGSKEELRQKLGSEIVGENVHRGRSVLEIHNATTRKFSYSRANLFFPDFNEFGMGTAKAEDGKLYLCQLFRRREETVAPPTT